MKMGWTEEYAKRWGEIYNSTAKTAVASFGDRGDRYIDPLKRRKMRSARRKARSIPTGYQVGFNDGSKVVLRNFKKRSSAVKLYLSLKKEGYGPHITSKTNGWATVFTAPTGRDLGTVTVVPNAELFTKPSMLPAIVRSGLPIVSKAEVHKGNVIEGTLSKPAGRASLWAGQSSYVKKRIKELAGLPILRDFAMLPRAERATLQCCLGVPAAILALELGLLFSGK